MGSVFEEEEEEEEFISLLVYIQYKFITETKS